MKITKNMAEEMRALYESGHTLKDIAFKYSLSRAGVTSAIKQLGASIRPKNKYTYNEKVFEDLTEEAAYWLGFIMADGCLHGKESCMTLEIGLMSQDIGHLYKFREFIQSDHPVKICWKMNLGVKYPVARIMFRAPRLVPVLAKYNIVPRKSTKEIAPDCLLDNPHFWRGVIDGDGSIMTEPHYDPTKNKAYVLSLVGSSTLVEQFREFCMKNSTTKANCYKHPTKNGYYFTITGAPAFSIISCLYKDATVYLDRKYQKAAEILTP